MKRTKRSHKSKNKPCSSSPSPSSPPDTARSKANGANLADRLLQQAQSLIAQTPHEAQAIHADQQTLRQSLSPEPNSPLRQILADCLLIQWNRVLWHERQENLRTGQTEPPDQARRRAHQQAYRRLMATLSLIDKIKG